MKSFLILFTISVLSVSVNAKQSMLDKAKDSLAKATESSDMGDLASGLNIAGLIGTLTDNLDVTDAQAQGGVASLMNYAKDNLSADDFSLITDQLSGTDSVLSQLPELADSSGGMGGLLSKASESLGGEALLAQQFESLGLDPDMIMGFVDQIQQYLDTPAGQQTKDLLMSGLSKLSA